MSYNSLKELCYTFFIEDAYGRKNYDLETLHWLLSYNGIKVLSYVKTPIIQQPV